MFKIGDTERKISVTTWNGSVRVHFRKFYQGKFDRRKFYPSKQGIALTLKEWNDLKTLVTQVDEVVDFTKIMLEEVKEERMEMNWVTGCDEMHQEEEQKKPKLERQIAVNEEEATDSLETFNEEVMKEIVRLAKILARTKTLHFFAGRTLKAMLMFPLSFKTRLVCLSVVSIEGTLKLYLH